MLSVKTKNTHGDKSALKGLVMGWLVELIVLMLGCGILTWVVLKGVLDPGKMGYGIIAILLVSAYSGAAIAVHKAGERRLAVCILSGIMLFCFLFGATMLLWGGRTEGALMCALLIAGGSICAGLVHCAEKSSGMRGRRKRRL